MLRQITVIQKKDRFGVGYKPNIGDSPKLDIPPLSSSFLSTDFINLDTIQGDEEEVMVDIAETFESLSIDMVEVEDQEVKDTGLPPFP